MATAPFETHNTFTTTNNGQQLTLPQRRLTNAIHHDNNSSSSNNNNINSNRISNETIHFQQLCRLTNAETRFSHLGGGSLKDLLNFFYYSFFFSIYDDIFVRSFLTALYTAPHLQINNHFQEATTIEIQMNSTDQTKW